MCHVKNISMHVYVKSPILTLHAGVPIACMFIMHALGTVV